MTDGGLKVELEPDLADRVRVFATAAGAEVASIVRDAVADYVDDWSETIARLAEYDRTGESVDGEEALRRFEDTVASYARSKD